MLAAPGAKLPLAPAEADATFDPFNAKLWTLGLQHHQVFPKFHDIIFRKFLVSAILSGSSTLASVHMVCKCCIQVFEDVDLVSLETDASFMISECLSMWEILVEITETNVMSMKVSQGLVEDANEFYNMVQKRSIFSPQSKGVKATNIKKVYIYKYIYLYIYLYK